MQATRHGSLALLPTMTLTIALSGAAQGPQGQEKRPATGAPSQASRPPGAPATTTALMPQPRSVDYGDGWLHVKGGFRVEWLGHRNSVLDRAVLRFQNDVARRTGLDVARASAARLRIDCRGKDKGYLTIDARERYSLAVKDDAVVLTADGPAGVLRGLATLRQSITNVPGGFAIPAMVIDDAPRFVWRGVTIDVARHFLSLPTLKRQIDAMELVKLNVLHLHLSDNEGFRVESRRYPKLHKVSSQGQFYSQAEIQELVSYAADRGVRIVPEFDVPGHSLAILRAYPEFASGKVENRDYLSAMRSALNPARPKTYTFLDRLFGEMAALFPDQYFHVGGDEISGADWAANSQIQDFMKANGLKTKAELESYFFDCVRTLVRAHGKAVIGWEEVGRTAIPDDVVVQTWRSSSAIARVTAQGNRVIVSGGYYIDKVLPGESHYRIDPHDPTSYGLTREQVAEGKKKGLPESILAEDSVIDPSLKLSPAQQALVLGGEGCLWTEIVTEEMLDGRLWPAAAVVAERFWSPASARDTAEMYRRLIVVHDGLRLAGLADDANRRRMAARLAPGESEPVALLLDLVAPVRNHAHNHGALALLKGKAPTPQEFNELADAASADSLVARRFALDAERFVRGDRSGAAALKANLASWRNNHDRFAKAARGNPKLEAALPISADIAALAGIGLDAVAAVESGRAPGTDWRGRAKELLDRQAAAEKTSECLIQALTMKQPPADLLISITPGVRKLVEAAVSPGR
ncbi:MAG TPA: family 20 glycosylhydrolase [Gemmataceae bacterium]|nr:family 20 glycosylhydrolase [Gemmataceae bacterium]